MSTSVLVQKGVGQKEGPGSHRNASESRPPVSEAGDGPADESERHKRKRTQNWKGKPEVLEQVNELIGELDTISSSIASQVRQGSFFGQITFLPCAAVESCQEETFTWK